MMQTVQIVTASGFVQAIVWPQVSTPPPPGMTFIHYDETKRTFKTCSTYVPQASDNPIVGELT